MVAASMFPKLCCGVLILVFCELLWLIQCSSHGLLTSEALCIHDTRFNPVYKKLYNTDVLWQIPEDPRAILYIAHGRFLDIFSFFDKSPGCELCYGLPEDRAIVLEALDRKYAVIVVKSLGGEWVSWPAETSQDKMVVTSIVTEWVETNGLGDLPMVGFGYSSGGNFTSMLSQYLGMKSIVILDSPGVYEVLEKANENFPPTLYFYMPKDPFFTSQILRNAKMMKSQGVQVSLIPIYEFPVTPHLFALRNPCISNRTSEEIFHEILGAGFLDKNLFLKISPWDFDYSSWLGAHTVLAQCGNCLARQVVQELNVAYAFHAMSSHGNTAMFEWFESSLPYDGLGLTPKYFSR